MLIVLEKIVKITALLYEPVALLAIVGAGIVLYCRKQFLPGAGVMVFALALILFDRLFVIPGVVSKRYCILAIPFAAMLSVYVLELDRLRPGILWMQWRNFALIGLVGIGLSGLIVSGYKIQKNQKISGIPELGLALRASLADAGNPAVIDCTKEGRRIAYYSEVDEAKPILCRSLAEAKDNLDRMVKRHDRIVILGRTEMQMASVLPDWLKDYPWPIRWHASEKIPISDKSAIQLYILDNSAAPSLGVASGSAAALSGELLWSEDFETPVRIPGRLAEVSGLPTETLQPANFVMVSLRSPSLQPLRQNWDLVSEGQALSGSHSLAVRSSGDFQLRLNKYIPAGHYRVSFRMRGKPGSTLELAIYASQKNVCKLHAGTVVADTARDFVVDFVQDDTDAQVWAAWKIDGELVLDAFEIRKLKD